MKLYKMIIHPYQLENNTKKPIGEFQNKWLNEEDREDVFEKIYGLYRIDGESHIKFQKRFQLRWEEKYVAIN